MTIRYNYGNFDNISQMNVDAIDVSLKILAKINKYESVFLIVFLSNTV